MALDKATVARVAKLARIDVPEGRQEALAAELSAILGWIERLNAVDTSGVEPLRAVVDQPAFLRPDAVTDGAQAEAVLRNAPASEDGYFVVPKVIE